VIYTSDIFWLMTLAPGRVHFWGKATRLLRFHLDFPMGILHHGYFIGYIGTFDLYLSPRYQQTAQVIN
jgi:hypothetical protein